VSDEEQGGPISSGCAAAIIVWVALLIGFVAFGFQYAALCLIIIPAVYIAFLILLAATDGFKNTWVHHRLDGWGRFVLITAGLSWIWYIPLTYLAIRVPPKAEADGAELSVIECLRNAAGQSFLCHALPILPVAFIALIAIRKCWQGYDNIYTERKDSLVYSGFLSLFVWSNPFVYSHYYVLKTLTSYPRVALIVIQLLLACACGFSIGYLPLYLRYRSYKRKARTEN
jgi:hypothetical protein